MHNVTSCSPRRVMLLGNNEFSQEIGTALQQLGVELMVIEDSLPNSYEPGCDPQKLRLLIEQQHPEIIIPLHVNTASEVLLQVEQEQLIRIVPTARALHLTRSRQSLRRFVTEELELPTSRYSFAKSFNELQMKVSMGIGYPCVIKPNSFLGKTHSMARDSKELKIAWERETSMVYPDPGVVVESMLEVQLRVSLLTLRAQGVSGQIETFFCEPIGHFYQEERYLGSWQPQRLLPHVLQKAHNIAKIVTGALGGMGMFEVDLFIQGDRIWFNQISVFPTEKSLVTLVSQEHHVFELHSRALLGEPIVTTLHRAAASLALFGKESIQPRSETRLHLFHRPLNHCLGVLLATGTNTQEAQQRANLAVSQSQ